MICLVIHTPLDTLRLAVRLLRFYRSPERFPRSTPSTVLLPRHVLSIAEGNNMRPTKACVQCRSGKRRCDGVKNAVCIQCARRHLPCSAAVSTPGHSPGAGVGVDVNFHMSHQTGLDDKVSSLVDLYFRRIDQKPHSLFHEPTFRASIAVGTASRTVLLSMMAMCARYV